jgi:hypothetical protein
LPKFVSLLFAGQGKVKILSSFSHVFLTKKVQINQKHQATDRSCEYLLGKSYLRVNPNLDSAIEMDDYTAFPQIGSTAEKYDLEPVIKWMEQNFK